MIGTYNNSPGDQLDYRDLKALFERSSVFQAWLDVERAIATAQADLGMIPAAAAENIVQNCEFDKLDLARIDAGFDRTKHPLVPIIDELVRLSGTEHGKYVHWGVTTQNVIQTGMLLQAIRASKTIKSVLKLVLKHLGSHASKHAKTLMAGRTHSRHAVPISCGYKFAVWIEELLQAIERVEEAEKRTFAAMMGGAVGCHSALGKDGPRFQSKVAELLGMSEMAVPSRAIRTHICEYTNALALMASVFHKIAEEVYLSSSEEFGEIKEGAPEGAVGSSTMPQKTNPTLSCQIIANANKLYGQTSSMLAVAHRPFESDASANNIIENGIAETIDLFAGILVPTEALLRNLVIDKERMAANLKLSQGTIFSEYAMMKTAEKVGKHQGHKLLREIASNASNGDQTFLDGLQSLPNGNQIAADIADMKGGCISGLCAEFALHYADLMKNLDINALPTLADRQLPSEKVGDC